MTEIRVLIVDDHAILRDGIRSLLDRQEDIRVVGEASNGREALARVGELLPDIVLMDVAMPEMNGLEATQLIRSTYPQVRVLILTQHDDVAYVEPLLRAGASGYVLKRSGGREVLAALRQVYEQGGYLEPLVARRVIETYAEAKNNPHAPENGKLSSTEKLTDREYQILQLIIAGKTNKEIAHLLGISAKTVSVHRTNLTTKLGVHSSVDLLRYAAQHGLLE